MKSSLCLICETCNTVSLNSTCECGLVASEAKDNTLYVYSDTPKVYLARVWLSDKGVITFLKKYKDLYLSKIIPVGINKEINEV